MQNYYNKLKLLCLFTLLQNSISHANIDLLSVPSIDSKLVSTSVLTSIAQSPNGVLAVGERGHILQWQNPTTWQQEQSPVSVLLTAITQLSDGTKIAVGHDAAILRASPDNHWQKVFDGYQLTTLKIALLEQQKIAFEQKISASKDDDEIEELEYQFDEVIFSLEDAESEQQAGPNKPLLAVTKTTNNKLFAVGAYGTLLTSENQGKTWTLIEHLLDNPDKFHLNDITYNQGVLTIVGENGISFRSTDEGASWEFIPLPYEGSIFGINGNNSETLVAYGLQGNILLSNDLGETWQQIETPSNISLLGGAMTAQGDVYLVGHGGIIIHFNQASPTELKVTKHPSGAALSDVTVVDNQLILAGQFGITAWQLN